MYQIDYSNRFDKDLKRCLKRGLNIKLIKDAIDILADTGRYWKVAPRIPSPQTREPKA